MRFCLAVMKPLLISKKEAAAQLGISTGLLDKLVRTGELERVRIGKRSLFRVDEIERLALPARRRRKLESIDPRSPVQ